MRLARACLKIDGSVHLTPVNPKDQRMIAAVNFWRPFRPSDIGGTVRRLVATRKPAARRDMAKDRPIRRHRPSREIDLLLCS